MYDPLKYIKKSTDYQFLIKLRDEYCPIDRENADTEHKKMICDIVEAAVNQRIKELDEQPEDPDTHQHSNKMIY